VAIDFGNVCIISCYLLPNEGIIKFKEILEELGDFVKSKAGKILLCGDFNAKSVAWGCYNDQRGAFLETWVSELI